MSELIRVSKQGIDVLGTGGTVPNNLIFDSTLNTFKIIGTGAALGTVTAGNLGTISVAHSLGTTPAVMGFIRMSTNRAIAPTGRQDVSGDSGYIFQSVAADSGSVYFVINSPFLGGVTGTYNCMYYAFEPPLS